MFLQQRSCVFVPCPVCQALRPTAKLARDTGRSSYCTGIGIIPSKVPIQKNKYNNESIKIKMPQNAPLESWCAGMQQDIINPEYII